MPPSEAPRQGKPAHLSHASELDDSVWQRVSDMNEFRLLLLAKKEFIIPATVTFIVYYFALPISVGYFPEFMSRKVWGQVNIAYLFALSQFFVAWAIAFAYVRVARTFDRYGSNIMQHLDNPQAAKGEELQ